MASGQLPGDPEDIWVAPLVQSKWDQGSVGDLHCYDFYAHWGSPDTYYPCGCVATAMAQVMRKHQHPTAGVSPACFPITVSGSAINELLQLGALPGGAYDWANMPLVPDASISLTQRQEAAARACPVLWDCCCSINPGIC